MCIRLFIIKELKNIKNNSVKTALSKIALYISVYTNLNKMATLQIKKHPKYSDYGADADGNIYSFKFGKIKQLQHSHHKRGYRHFCIKQNDESRMYLVHRFVYECLTEELISKGLQCHHIDHNKQNNSLDNLQLVTQLENMAAGIEAGVLYGSANPNHPFYRG